MQNYSSFLSEKRTTAHIAGMVDLPALNPNLFDFQRDIVSWALRRGRAAIFAGTGLGKSLMELSYADAIYKKTGGSTLILTPLAVAGQMIREGAKFGIEANQCSVQADCVTPICVTNYQKIEHFDLSKFDAIVLDESSILKNESGHYRNRLIELCRDVPYRLAATATPAPNDFMEIGNHSEFLNILSYTDMLATFFCHDGGDTAKWRLKGHGQADFWKWMASWGIMMQSPSDLGYDGSKYALPALHKIQHTISAPYSHDFETGLLFPVEATTLGERLSVRRSTIDDRVAKAATLAEGSDIFVIWCNLNDESAMLAKMIGGAVEVRGGDSESKKESILSDFSNGKIRVLVTKPSICGFGMNWQHCHNTIFVGLNDSFEQIYQALRRFWRFGQKNEVTAHFIASELEGAVLNNIRRKEIQAEEMMRQMVSNTSDISSAIIKGAVRENPDYTPSVNIKFPSFVGAEK